MQSTIGSSIDDGLDVRQEILHHLSTLPTQGATWEEILEWWLMERAIERESRRVQRALRSLVAEGRLHRHRDRRGHTRYEIVAPSPDEPGSPSGPSSAPHSEAESR